MGSALGFRGGVDCEAELGQGSAPMARSENQGALLRRARAAAKTFRHRGDPLAWTEALAAAPWASANAPAFESDFRRAFAEVLVKRGLAVAQTRLVEAGPDRVGRAAPRVRSSAISMRRLVPGTADEFAEQDQRASAAGLSWSAWARRKLASPD
jgi:hypothetical protein